VVVIKRIHVRYELRLDQGADRSKVERAHGLHADHCPVARSIRDAIDITTELAVTQT
jgi:uncharacterized OsmC-like protein